MALQGNMLHAAFAKTLDLGSKSVDLKGKFLFCWPYIWEDTVNWENIQMLTRTVTDWVQTCLPDTTSERVQSHVVFALYHCPSTWRHTCSKDQRSYDKLVLYSKIMHLYYEIDDTTEEEEGNAHHAPYVKSVGAMVTKILQYDFKTQEELKRDKLYGSITQISKLAGSLMELLNDCAMDLKEHFGVTKDMGQYFSRQSGYIYSMQSWCGVNNQQHYLNPYTQYHLRQFTGGICALQEIVFLLEGIHVPRSVRDNPFWARCLEVAGFLPTRVNDIISVEKEWKQVKQFGKAVDNVVFHYMDATNCTFEQAVTRGLGEHNLALKEFHDFLKYFKNNPKMLEELTEEEKDIFARSTSVMAEYVSCGIQGQLLMRRYNSGLKLSFESCIVYGLGSQD
ncbi:unnamed protein product [Allacma fusca]|uniref:Uncharacterized protein n=1 Tax=Allacma fusca TaxID=39272 RepID=A0A8J2KHU9_9HEXA|nr:unnamed protein product [Allacma fusca]